MQVISVDMLRAVLAEAAGRPLVPGQGMAAGPAGMADPVPAVQQPGGDLLTRLLHPSMLPVDELYRVAPDDGWFDPNVNSRNPIQFELGAFNVPKGQSYWLFDYAFTPYRLSGMTPGDTVPVEDGRMTSIMGFDLTVDSNRFSSLRFQLDPVPVQTGRAAFNTPVNPRTQSDFNAAAFANFGSTAGQGLSLLPARRQRQGAPSAPWTIVAREGTRVVLTCVIFRRVPTPLGFIQGEHSGFLVNNQVSDALINRLRPR